MSTEDIKIDIKEEPLFDEKSEWKTIVKSELDSKLTRKDICINSQSIKCEEDFCVKEEELDCPLDFGSADIQVSSFSTHKFSKFFRPSGTLEIKLISLI